MTAVTGLRAELRADALGVGTAAPRLSWRLEQAPEPAEQAEARMVSADGSSSTVPLVAPDGVLVDWPFPELVSRQRVEVSVRALVAREWSDWSEPLAVEAALLEQGDWSEPLVVPSAAAVHELRPSHLLRAEFTLDEAPASARLYVTAQGVFTAALNGGPLSDEHLAPGWTSYTHRLRYRVHDVTAMLRAGANVIGAELADGWFRGRIGFDGGLWDVFGEHVGLLAQLEVTDAQGDTRVVPLGDAWRQIPGPATRVGLYEGESYDARLLPDGWLEPGFDPSAWRVPQLRPVVEIGTVLEAAVGEPVRPIESLRPVSVEKRPSGRLRLDFGQNISGVLRVKADLPAGRTLRMHHAEVLENDELGTRPLREAPSIDSYTSDGSGPFSWAPRFTIHGFRYAELEGWHGDLADVDVEALVIHTDMERRGWFACSDPMLEKLHENTVWSMRDNFVDLPTDCPQRDERMGWTGDIQVFAPAAEFLYGADGVLTSWLRDVAAEQGSDGWVPNFVPWVECGFPRGASAAWGDAATIVPWTMYQRRGDLSILREQWPSMKAWVDHLALRVGPGGVVEGSMELGDWLDPAAPPENPAAARTDKYLVASAYAVRSARIVADTAVLLGDLEAEAHYRAFAERVAEATRRRWFEDLASIADAPTALALGLEFGLVEDPDARRRLGDLLAAAVREGGHHVQTGFVGTPIICDALASSGHLDDAYALLLQQECPSWLYPVSMGATTIWERWDSMLPDGSINPGGMTSFNHYALGAVVDFLHRVVAGLAPSAPGYREITVQPRPGGGLTSASASHLSPFGMIAVSWELADGLLALDVEVPTGVSARVILPDGGVHTVGAGAHHYSAPMPAAQKEATR
ncbi:family 78 glycoside hydrolase catalytic domain [Demequina zhanjiangensis]|uniref:alpha-L-rhamnosidase n=1 Tax=Demequina zhanjiangensis TaxID=3051659 RepID=A0ABT8FXU4_9MICO|nr:family 78 glycoside hydrolase catalytic domain [Demequina sp. SYSU T00b26]MDN4471721.1 family 78 glycoside hydrolase catalytic domain [Demequina sp. SYSU T00b26]